MWVLFREFLVNLGASAIGELSSPSGMMGYLVALGFMVLAVVGWHSRRKAVGKRGVDSWYFIALSLVVAMVAIGVAAYGVGLRAGNKDKDSPSPTQGNDTHLSLKFGPAGSTPIATDLANVWRWYALASIAVVVLPDGQRKEIKSWNLFMTFDKPIDAKQVIIEGGGLPQYEVKDRDSRSVVIAFLGDIFDTSLKVRIDSSVGTKGEDRPKSDTPAQIASPPNDSPPVLRRPYFGRSKELFDENLTTISRLLNGRGSEAVRKADQVASLMSPHPLRTQWSRYANIDSDLVGVRATLDEIRSTIFQKMLEEHYDQAVDLNDVLQGDVQLSKFVKAVDGVRRTLANFKDIFDKVNDQTVQDRAAELFGEGRESFAKNIDDFKMWIEECNKKIALKRKALG
jgi:hypothetical protein